MPCHGHSARFGIAACKTGIYVAMFGKNLAKIIGRIVIRRIGMSQIKLIQVKTANQKLGSLDMLVLTIRFLYCV